MTRQPLTPPPLEAEIRARIQAPRPVPYTRLDTSERAEVAGWLDRGRAGLARQFDAESGLCADYDVRAGERILLDWTAPPP